MNSLLGVQTHYSFHWGTPSPAECIARAEELGYTHVGFADLASLHGLPEIVVRAENSSLTPLYGVTFPYGKNHTLTGFVANALGYGNLCQRVSEWHEALLTAQEKGAGGLPVLRQHEAVTLLADGRLVDGVAWIADDPEMWRRFRSWGAEVYWRIGPTLAAPPPDIDTGATVFLPGPFMLCEDDFDTHRLLRSIGAASTLDRFPAAGCSRETYMAASFRMGTPDAVVQSPDWYMDKFAMYGEAISRTDALAHRLADFIPCQNTLYPPTPESVDTPAGSGESAMARLRRLAYAGARARYNKPDPAVRQRLEMELELIGRKGFAEYFLVVHDIVARLAGGDGKLRKGRSVTCGRGSGAASLVNYCLGVTNVDALKHDLMFERFLNDGRKDPPDIDIDFAWDERDDLLDKVLHTYGNDRVGRVANHNRYDWRGAFRATARAKGYADPEITRHMQESPSVYGDSHLGNTPLPNEVGEAVPATVRVRRKLEVLRRPGRSEWNDIARLSRRLVDKPHGLSMHCGGIVISSGTLCRSVPVVTSRKGQPTIQWEKDGSETMGLVKIDLLGNRSLAVIRDAVQAISRDTGLAEEVVIAGDPTEDEATKELVRRGDTFGVFYLESPSMRLLMAKAGKGDFDHAVIHSSIIRPAANAFINEYIERARNGKEWRGKGDPRLEGLFDESYGIPVYQEDVVKLAMALCGYGYDKADAVRKCLGKRDAKEQLSAQFPDMKKAAQTKGFSDETIREFWRILMSMTGYSFCKPHSASYAQISYEAAYLRAHYPAYFIAAVLSNGGGYYSTQAYVSEAMRMGLQVLGPDVNASDAKWRAEGSVCIRTGLMAVSGLSRQSIRRIVGERLENGCYVGLEDFLARVQCHTDDVRRLVLSGCLDSLAPDFNRPQLAWCAAEFETANRVKPAVSRKAQATGSLFATRTSSGTVEPPTRLKPPPLTDYGLNKRREIEYDLLGFIPGYHPMILHEKEIRDSARPLLRRHRPLLIKAGQISRHVGRMVTILAWPVAAKIVETKHHDAMMFQSFEDFESLCEAVIFPEEFSKYHRLLSTVQPLWVTGKVLEEFGVATLQVMAVRSVCEAARDERSRGVIPGMVGGESRTLPNKARAAPIYGDKG